jgi:Ca-activated chloride channel family protein
MTKLDEELLKKMALLTKGTYVRSVAGDMDLDVIYKEEIRGKMEAEVREGGRKKVWTDRYQWFLFIAVLMMGIEMLISSRGKTTALMIAAFVFLAPITARADVYTEAKKAYENKDYETALKKYIDAQLEEPDRPEISYNIGNTLYKLKDYETAFNHFKDVIESENKIDDKLRKKALYNLGNTSFRMQKYEDAIKYYEKSLEIDPPDQQAKENIEFTKKVMEQLKKQSQKNRDQNDRGKEEKNKSSQEKKDTGEGKQNKKEKQSANKKEDTEKKTQKQNKPEPKDDKDQDANVAKPSEPSPEPAPKKDKGSMAKANQDQKEEENVNEHQAARLLNRLRDQPGKAQIPVYGGKRVEKDW